MLKRGYEPLWEQIIRPQCINAGITLETEMTYYFVYFQAGFTMLLKHWVENGCREDDSRIAEIIRKCIPDIWQ